MKLDGIRLDEIILDQGSPGPRSFFKNRRNYDITILEILIWQGLIGFFKDSIR